MSGRGVGGGGGMDGWMSRAVQSLYEACVTPNKMG